MTILVTGSTGTIGSKVLRTLAENKVQVRAAVRSADGSKALKASNITAVEFDFDKPDTVAAALEGVERAFLLPPNVHNQVEVTSRFIDLAKAAGVKHIVKLSAFGCELEPTTFLRRGHRAVEKHLERSGVAWTHLRPNNFMQNFTSYNRPDPQGNIYMPWGTARCSFIAAEDVGEVAARVLTSDGHASKAYTLTGPAGLTIAEVAESLSRVSGRQIRYVDVPEDGMRKVLLGMKLPPPHVEALLEMHAFDKSGRSAGVTSSVKDVLGRDAQRFEVFADAYASSWKS